MDCTRFESELARVMEGGAAGGERASALERLRRHAADCPDCAGCADLLGLLSRPAGERDLIDIPGEDYWKQFGDRLRTRIDERPRSGRRALAIGAAAAVLLAAVGAWIVFDRAGEGRPVPAPVADELGDELPDALAEALERSAKTGLMEEMGFLDGLTGGWDAITTGEPGVEEGQGEWLYPAIEDLAPATRRELLEWLRGQNEDERGTTS